ncbi:MAG: prepilin-type N-terminal cleavage/methylation domain-containing protein [Planctomycetes bacterium]|nr:prepilin-type N-terminal cleavage/methylation domain-containing protein [Planctomycetota bacterium]MCB9905565.1 prepilin-type N-terminal cleavage/methylation domain-containing protein [Planctomycetota bacterium]
MRRPSMQRGQRAGFTIVELLVSMSLVSVMAGLAMMIQSTGNNALKSSTQQTEAESRARRGLDRVARELQRAVVMNMFTNFTPLAPDSPSLTYLSAAGLVNGVLVPGSITSIAWESDPRDPDNGVDDDGDGLVDEGVVALWKNVGEGDQVRVVICTDVTEFFAGELNNGADDNGNGLMDEAGLHFVQDGNLITMRLSVEDVASDGTRVSRTAETSIRMRN